jgi:hypothetical protein
MFRKTLCAVMVAVFIAGFASAAGEVMFQYKFAPGAKERHRLKLDTEIEMMGMDITQTADMAVTVTCVSADKDVHTMSMVFDKVDASMTMGGNMQQDPSAAKMTGKSVTFTVDVHGDVANITPGPGFDAWPEVQQVIEPTLKNWYVYFPANTVPVSGNWKRENHHDKSVDGAEYVTNESYTFSAMKKEKAGEVAVVDSDVTANVGGSTTTPMGVFDLAGSGKGKFQFAFNPKTGTITRLKGTMETAVDMKPKTGGDAMKTSFANHIDREQIQ